MTGRENLLVDLESLSVLAENYDPSCIPWEKLRELGLRDRTMPARPRGHTCGKILAHAKQQVQALREQVGIKVCIFKIGVSSNPLARFLSYAKQGYSHMWVICQSEHIPLVHMLEAALISELGSCAGCRNQPGTGGEGALNRSEPFDPPSFVYVVAAPADQPRWVG